MNALVVPAAKGPAVLGAPASSMWQRRSSTEVAKADRFDFCRKLSMGSHVERPLGAHGDFFGEFAYTATPDGTAFAEIDIDPCMSRFGPSGDDSRVDVGMVNAGSMHIRYGRDQTLVLNAGAGPAVFDAARPMTTRTSRIGVTYLSLPRAIVVAAIGGDAVPRGAAVRPFASNVLTAQLAACLRGLQDGQEQSAATITEALRTASALALVALANARGAGHHWRGGLGDALYRVTRYQLSLRVADPQVTVDAVAAVVGCSRAQVYRLFDTRGESVAGCLRELRMQRAADLLQSRPSAAIGQLAARCGYSEPVAFDRAFRRRFGMTPSDWRAAASHP